MLLIPTWISIVQFLLINVRNQRSQFFWNLLKTKQNMLRFKTSTPVTIEKSQNTKPLLIQDSLIQEPKVNPIPIQEVTIETQEIISLPETLDLQAILTRGMQAKMQKPLNPLKTPTFPDLDLTVE